MLTPFNNIYKRKKDRDLTSGSFQVIINNLKKELFISSNNYSTIVFQL